MKRTMLYRKVDDRSISSTRLADVFHNWQDKEERWLFVAVHDDDVVIGSGLMLQKAGEEGIP